MAAKEGLSAVNPPPIPTKPTKPTQPPKPNKEKKSVWYAIVVNDPAKMFDATGETWGPGELYSLGSEVAGNGVLNQRGLNAIEVGDEQPDLLLVVWSVAEQQFVPAPVQPEE